MITLNIIPEKLKKNAEYKVIFYQVRKILVFILFCSVFYSALLFGAKFTLGVYAKESDQSSITKTKQTEDYFNEVKNINDKIVYIETIQKDIIVWTDFLKDFTNQINDNIYISKISLNKTSKTIEISGNAKKIEDLEIFEKKINEIKYLDKFVIPDNLFFKKDNIDFDLKSTIINYEFN